MPLSYFQRPLVIVLVLYILVLSFLKCQGFFRIVPPREILPYVRLPPVQVEGQVVSGFAPKFLGDRIELILSQVSFARESHSHPGHLGARSKVPESSSERANSLRDPVFIGNAAMFGKLRVLAYLSRGDPDTEKVRPGQHVRLEGRLRLPRWPRNPGEFDEQAFLENRGCVLVFHAGQVEIKDSHIPMSWQPWARAESARRSMHAYFHQRFSKPHAGLLEGFLIGTKGTLPAPLNQAIRDAGAAHLLVPSGTNVTFLLLSIFTVTAYLGWPWGMRCLSACAIVGFYGLMAGADPPYIRAYLAALVFYAARLLDRESGHFSGMVLAALATLLLNPRALFSESFQMTYLAVLALLIAMPRWSLPRRWPLLVRLALQALLASLAVQLLLWPIFAQSFGRGSVVGLLANVLLVPVSGFILAVGFFCWGFSFLPFPFSWLETCAVALASWSVEYFSRVCFIFAALPYAAMDLQPMQPTQIAIFYLGAFGFLLIPQWRSAFKFCGASALMGFTALIAHGMENPPLRALFFSQPQGHGTLISLPDGRHILFDAGVRPALLRRSLRVLGVERLDAIWVNDLQSAARLDFDGGHLKIENLASPDVGRDSMRIELRFRDLRLFLGPGEARVVIDRDPKKEYCIMASPSAFPHKDCVAEKHFFTRWHGAVWVLSDGEHIEIKTQRQLHSLGRSVL